MFPHPSVLRGPKVFARAAVPLRARRKKSSRTTRLRVESLEERRLLSVTASPLADIGLGRGSDPEDFVTVGEVTYFSANDGAHGRELWKTDGTAEGTVMVKDIDPGSSGSVASETPLSFDGMLFFFADDGIHGNALWKTDGTEGGTVLVEEVGDEPDDLTNVAGAIFFSADDALWRSDGTEAGTVIVKQFGSLSSIRYLTDTDGTLFFSANDGAHGIELWKSDGTESGTVMVKDIRPSDSSRPSLLTNVSGTLHFFANDGTLGTELWRSDGTTEGTVLVKDVRPGGEGVSFRFGKPVNFNGTLFFAADDGTHGNELWRSDGTAEGTVMLADLNPGGDGSLQSVLPVLSNVDGTLYFFANDGTHGHAVWKSDGSQEGTVLVKDIFPGSQEPWLGIRSWDFMGFNGEAFFVANDGTSGYEMWKTDGTAEGTVLVKDIAAGISSAYPIAWATANGKLLFGAADVVHGEELWASDGTAEGTVLVKDVNPDTNWSSRPAEFMSTGNVSYFVAAQPASGLELWRTDGTAEETLLVADVLPGPWSSRPHLLTNVDGVLYFVAFDSVSWDTVPVINPPLTLFKSDGTPEGTVRVKQILPAHLDNFSLGPRNLVNVNGTLYFDVEREETPGRRVRDLWKSDGTEEGTEIIAEWASDPTNVDGTLFFSVTGPGVSGLWKTDGTEEGTVRVKQLSFVSRLQNFNGTLMFYGGAQPHGRELWRSDGTGEGTVLVKDINPGPAGSNIGTGGFAPIVANGALYFSADDGSHGAELWKSDGTEAGTMLVKDVRPGIGTSYLDQPATVDGMLFFRAVDGTHGREWWRSDGTEAGTVLLKDINPGPAGSNPFYPGPYLASVNGTAYLVADDGSGSTLWMSDGSEAGTVKVMGDEVAPGDPRYLANVGGVLLFSAFDDVHGFEPWIVAPEVVPRLFYHDSGGEGDARANDAAMAGDKLAYYAGSGTALFENVSSFVHGITGITVDLSTEHGAISADEFIFRMGADNAPATWTAAPAPTGITVRPGAGVAGGDRVELVWDNGAIVNTWLEVTVKGNDEAGGFNTNTGLEASTVFYFGSRIGDTGGDGSPAAFVTTAADQIAVRRHQGPATSMASRYDFDRNGVVDATDEMIARANIGFLMRLDLPSPAEAPPGEGGVGAAAVATALARDVEAEPAGIDSAPAAVRRLDRGAEGVARADRLPAAALFEPDPATRRRAVGEGPTIDLALDEDLLDSLLFELAPL